MGEFNEMEKKTWQKRVLIIVLVLASLLPLLLVLEIGAAVVMLVAPDSALAEFITNILNFFIRIFFLEQ